MNKNATEIYWGLNEQTLNKRTKVGALVLMVGIHQYVATMEEMTMTQTKIIRYNTRVATIFQLTLDEEENIC